MKNKKEVVGDMVDLYVRLKFFGLTDEDMFGKIYDKVIEPLLVKEETVPVSCTAQVPFDWTPSNIYVCYVCGKKGPVPPKCPRGNCPG